MKRLITLLALAACGDNNTQPDASTANPDAPPDGTRPPQAIVVAGDFVAGDPGVITSVDEATFLTHQNLVAGAVDDDPILRRIGGDLFVINRVANNVTILDGSSLAVLDQIATGAGSNPQDVAVAGDKLYIPVLGGPGVLVVVRSTNAMSMIDLSADDPKDGLPDCNSAFTVGDKVFVSCEILDSFKPAGNGKVHVIDTTNDSVAASFDLQHKNPFGVFEALPDGSLAIPTIDFQTGAGCVEQVTTTGTPASGGCVVNNSDMGATGSYASGMTVSGSTLWLAIPAPDFLHAALRPFDLTGNTLGTALNPDTQVIGDLATCPDGNLVVSDKGTPAGVRFYDATHELTQNPISVGLKPQSAHGLTCY